MKSRKVNGKIKLKPIEFSEILELEVKRANKSSGRIYLPEKLIGKKVYVLVDEKEK
jgi:putative transposon-encoded protein